MQVSEQDWFGLHGESWKGIIVDESFQHPAKYARGLIHRIYQHAVDEGWLRAGDTVVDPFSGVSLGAWAALPLGINFVGNELERPFHDLSVGVDCTGISKADWVRFHGRADKARYLEGRHWCPRCMAQVGIILPPKSSQLEMFTGPLTASYRRDSGVVPHTEPHHYTGNLELFARHSRNGAQAVCLLGDSRELAEVLKGAGFAGMISSPPFLNQLPSHDNFVAPHDTGKRMAIDYDTAYGSHPAQLGNMPPGRFENAVSNSSDTEGINDCKETVTLPCPYCHSPLGDGDKSRDGEALRCYDCGSRVEYWDALEAADDLASAQLAAMPAGDAPCANRSGLSPVACISSPPYINDPTTGAIDPSKMPSQKEWWAKTWHETMKKQAIGYGSTPGNLAQLPEGDVPVLNDESRMTACISPPPWEESDNRGAAKMPDDYFVRQDGTPFGEGRAIRGVLESDDNLGNSTGDTFWSAAKAIVQQVYQVLAPGGHAVWITKMFVRDKKLVDFPGQWRDLCESVGFVTLHQHRAHLIEDRGTQVGLDGELNHRTVKRSSFFRRLHEKKYPHLAIDFEVVLCQVKPR